MSYYRYSPEPKKPKWTIHPIWRGIGLIAMILIPIMAYLSAQVFFQYAPISWLQMFPPGAYENFVIPYLDIRVPFNLGTVIMTFIFMFILFAVFTIFYALFMKIAGPSKYGPTDVPPIRRKTRKSR